MVPNFEPTPKYTPNLNEIFRPTLSYINVFLARSSALSGKSSCSQDVHQNKNLFYFSLFCDLLHDWVQASNLPSKPSISSLSCWTSPEFYSTYPVIWSPSTYATSTAKTDCARPRRSSILPPSLWNYFQNEMRLYLT